MRTYFPESKQFAAQPVNTGITFEAEEDDRHRKLVVNDVVTVLYDPYFILKYGRIQQKQGEIVEIAPRGKFRYVVRVPPRHEYDSARPVEFILCSRKQLLYSSHNLGVFDEVQDIRDPYLTHAYGLDMDVDMGTRERVGSLEHFKFKSISN